MSEPRIVSREEWERERRELLAEEKAAARALDALAEKRRALPWIRIDQNYTFHTTNEVASLAELFGDYSQLIVQHIMFDPAWDAACPICSFWADGYNPMITHLKQRDVAFVGVSRAPLLKITEYRERMGWSFDWVSSHGSSFNYDFGVSASEADQARGTMTYNYADSPVHVNELHGTSVFQGSRQQ